MREAVALVLAMLASIACSAPTAAPDAQDWAIPVPPGTRIIELDHVPVEGRTARIELVEDLVIGERGDDLNYAFGRHFPKVAVDGEGRIYACDNQWDRIQVFDREGDYVRTIGRRGQGPGEFELVTVLTIAGDVLVASQPDGEGSIAWTLEGEYLYELDIPAVPRRAAGVGLRDGTFVGGYLIRGMEGVTAVVVRRDASGAEIHRYAEVSGPVQITWAVHPSGVVYVNTVQGERQQITAFDAGGEMRWAVRTRHPMTGTTVQGLAAGPGAELYVFWPCGDEMDGRCVDVYAPAGERRLAARSADINLGVAWQAVDASHVYGADSRSTDDQWRIVRYRVAETSE